MKKTFAQLKRDLKVGTKVKTILNRFKEEKNGEIRRIALTQSNAIAFEIPAHTDCFGRTQDKSWLWRDKANCYDYKDNIFKVYHFENEERVLDFIYEIMEEER